MSGGKWIAAAALVILIVCGCVAMATKQVCRSYLSCMYLVQVPAAVKSGQGLGTIVSFPDYFSVAGNEYVLGTSVCQGPSSVSMV